MGIEYFLWKKDQLHRWSTKILLILSVAMGVMALVALEAFSSRILHSIEQDTKSLLAADFQVQAWRELPPAVVDAAKSLADGGQVIAQTDFLTTAHYVREGLAENITVQLRALEGPYPFYGAWKTDPQMGIENLRQAPLALLDASLKARGFKVGDALSFGRLTFHVAGFVQEEPQTVASAFALGPRIIIHQKWMAETGLLEVGSRAFHMLLIKSHLPQSEFRRSFRQKIPDPHWRLVTPERANRQASAVIEKVRGFLACVALAAVLLGGVGVFMIFRSQFLLRLPQYLTLRCLGVRSRSLVLAAAFEAATVAILGWLVGSVFACAIESALAAYAHRAVGLELAPISYVEPLLLGLLVAVVTVLVAVALPLREILRVPVSQALRESETETRALSKSDALFSALAAIVLVAAVGRDWRLIVSFAVSMTVVTLVLLGLSIFLIKQMGRLRFQRPLAFKHALIAYSRKKASSQLFLICLGQSLFLLSSVLILGYSLRSQIDFSHRIGVPNLYLLGVPEAARDGIRDVISDVRFAAITQVRLTELKGQPIEEKNADPTDMEQFYRVREYTVTRRADLDSGEELSVGHDLFGAPVAGYVRISLDQEFVARIGLKVGDRLKLEIAGVPVPAEVRSLRKVGWFNLKPNFYIVLDPVDIPDAPMDYVGVALVPKPKMESIQRRLAERFPQITALDAEAISQRLIHLLGQLAFAIATVSIFSLGACLFVFFGVLVAKRPEKFREISLWRCFGMGRRDLSILMLGEFVLSGWVAGIASMLVSVVVVWAGCTFGFGIPMVAPPVGLFIIYLIGIPAFLALSAWLVLRPLLQQSAAQLFRRAEEL